MIQQLHRNERGQTALETAIILIAFVVVASVFAFTILSAGSASTEKGEAAINAGLEGVQSSMSVKGAVIAQDPGGAGNVENLVFTLSLVSGGDPVDLTDTTGSNVVVIGYRDGTQFVNQLTDWTTLFIGTNDADLLLEGDELAEITVPLTSLTTPLGPNTAFTLEIKPPTGAVLSINRTTPAAVEAVMELQ
jgi:flagellin FlaB